MQALTFIVPLLFLPEIPTNIWVTFSFRIAEDLNSNGLPVFIQVSFLFVVIRIDPSRIFIRMLLLNLDFENEKLKNSNNLTVFQSFFKWLEYNFLSFRSIQRFPSSFLSAILVFVDFQPAKITTHFSVSVSVPNSIWASTSKSLASIWKYS